MSRAIIAKYVTPWKYKREQEEATRLRALRERDGENCARCRRPMRFDLPAGHDQGARLEPVVPGTAKDKDGLDNLRLCHGRCNPVGVNHTDEVLHRARLKNEAALFARAKESRAA